MLRASAIIFGFLFIAFGIMGFIPYFMTNGKLFDIFRLNFEHNVVHLATGVISLLCGLISSFSSRNFFITCGVIYALLAVLGFQQGEGKLFSMITVNFADNVLHAGFGIVFLVIGFSFKS